MRSRATFAGRPITSTPSGICLPSVTSAPAPTSTLLPITAPFSTVAVMPIRLPSPIVQPCSIARCPTVQPAPTVSGKPLSVWQTQPSCTLVFSPTTIGSMSPRSTALNQTAAPAPSRTRPISRAPGATQASAAISGATPSSV